MSGDERSSSSEDDYDDLDQFNAEEIANFERIKELVKKTSKMQAEARERTTRTTENLKNLTQRLNDSDIFLKNAKKQIDNIKITISNDRKKFFNDEEFAPYTDKTCEEIEDELVIVKQKLENVHRRLNELTTINDDATNESKETYKDAINHTIANLEKVTKQCYESNKL